jgi:hypothetical protein
LKDEQGLRDGRREATIALRLRVLREGKTPGQIATRLEGNENGNAYRAAGGTTGILITPALCIVRDGMKSWRQELTARTVEEAKRDAGWMAKDRSWHTFPPAGMFGKEKEEGEVIGVCE